MYTSSAESDRNFSTIDSIRMKLRNRLRTASVRKFVYVKTNMGVLYDYLHEYLYMTEEYEAISYDDSCIVI